MFDALQKDFEDNDQARENTIIISRGIIRLSKKVIAAVHAEKPEEAEKYTETMEKEVKSMEQEKGDTGNYNVAMQEYAEAKMLFHFAKTGVILSYETMNITPQNYLGGLMDFVGELQRRAVLKISRGDKEEIKVIYKHVTTIYDSLLNFSFRGELRKKFDSLKYIMVRMEDILLELKLRS